MISPLNDAFQSNITIMFNISGIGVNVECMQGLMHVRASAPSALFVYFNNKFFLSLLIVIDNINLRKTLVACLAIGIISQEMTSQVLMAARIS